MWHGIDGSVGIAEEGLVSKSCFPSSAGSASLSFTSGLQIRMKKPDVQEGSQGKGRRDQS